MQILDRNGTVTVRLIQAEGRKMRDAAYIATRIAKNLSDADRSKRLEAAAAEILATANEFTPEVSARTLDAQDGLFQTTGKLGAH